MTLYYEDVPADGNETPQLPPLLSAVSVPVGQDVYAKAIDLASSSDIGTVFYSEAINKMYIAVLLGPEVPVANAGQMLFAMMIAAGDAIGALAPPEVVVNYQMPGYILLNQGRAGIVRIKIGPLTGDEHTPEWMVVSVELIISDNDEDYTTCWQNGEFEYTSLAEEGGGFISRTRLVESCSRHFLVWVNRWQDEGFRPLHDAWIRRLDSKLSIVCEKDANLEWLGIDENGGVLVKLDGKPIVVLPHDLENVCGAPGLGRP